MKISDSDTTMEEIREIPYGKLTREQARARIAYQVGLNTKAWTKFGKRESNAIYAHITGEHYVKPAVLTSGWRRIKRSGNRHDPDSDYTLRESPPIETFRRQIIRASRDVLREEGALTEQDAKMLSYVPPRGGDCGFQVAALRRLAQFVESHSDQRPSPSPPKTLAEADG